MNSSAKVEEESDFVDRSEGGVVARVQSAD